MGLGEIPARTSMRVYYRMENANDSSGNGRTLTNNNSVAFNDGKFSNCADFDSSGTNKSLRRGDGSNGQNIMSGLTFANATVSFWVKFNSTSDPTGSPGYFFDLMTGTFGAGRAKMFLRYSVVGGDFVIDAKIKLTTTDATFTYNIPTNTTNWYHFVMQKVSTTTVNLYVNGNLVATDTGAGTDTQTDAATANLSIGNRGTTTGAFQVWCKMDEFIVEERVWSASEIRKYYTQGRGGFAAQ